MPRKSVLRSAGGRYKPVNIRNPSGDGHVVVVHAGQSVRVGLNAAEYPAADVLPVSEILVPSMRGTETVKDKVTEWFEFEQLFDPAPWLASGSAHLGHLQVTAEGLNKICLPVVLREGGRVAETCVTVVNPRDDQVRLKPGQLLHVVLHIRGDRDCKETFSPVVNPLEGTAWLKCVRSETVLLDGGEPPPPDQLFDPGVWLTDRLRRNSDAEMPPWLGQLLQLRVFRQHHFWFAVDPTAAGGAAGGSSSLVVWNLACGSPSYTLRVLLPASGRRAAVDSEEWNAMLAAAAQRGLYQKHLDLHKGVLVGPGEVEMVDLLPGKTDKGFLIEIPPPSRDGTTPISEALSWAISLEPVVTTDGDKGPAPRMGIEELESRVVNGVPLKRVLVRSHLDGLPADMDSFFLGTLHAKPQGINLEHLGVKDRRLKIWLSKKLERAAKSSGSLIKPEEKPGGRRKKARTALGPVKTYRTVARITIEELKGEGLEHGAKCVEYSDIQLGTTCTVGKKKTKGGAGGGSTASVASPRGTAVASTALPALPLIGPPPWCLTVTNPSDRQACIFRFGGQVVFRMPLFDNTEEAWWKFRAELKKGQDLIRHRENMIDVDGRKWQQFWFRHRVSDTFTPGRWIVGRLLFEGQGSGLEVNLAAELPLVGLPEAGKPTRVSYHVAALGPAEMAIIKVGDELELNTFKHVFTVERGGTHAVAWSCVEWPWWLAVVSTTSEAEGYAQSFVFRAQDRVPATTNGEGVIALRAGETVRRVKVKIVE
jgi:hypothetical protein